jgi:putative addiction module component (TIGR02574 family)
MTRQCSTAWTLISGERYYDLRPAPSLRGAGGETGVRGRGSRIQSMALSIELLEAEAMQLPAGERARLVERLIASLDIDPEVEEAWASEVERRNNDREWGGRLAFRPRGPRGAEGSILSMNDWLHPEANEDLRCAAELYHETAGVACPKRY